MTGFICRNCRAVLRKTRARPYSTSTSTADGNTISQKLGRPQPPTPVVNPSHLRLDVEALLSADNPTWSVRSLLPSKRDKSLDENNDPKTAPMTSKQLHHLLRLSALPLPKDEKEEAKMLKDLKTQLGFVRAIREVNTKGVEPLVMLRDESAEGVEANTIGLETKEIKEALAGEVVKGKNRRPRRIVDEGGTNEETGTPLQEKWDALGTAEHKVGNYFVVKSGKPAPGTEKVEAAKPLIRKLTSSRIRTKEEVAKSREQRRKGGKEKAREAEESGNAWKILAAKFGKETAAQRAVMLNMKLAAQQRQDEPADTISGERES